MVSEPTPGELAAGTEALEKYRYFIVSDGEPATRVGPPSKEVYVVLKAALSTRSTRVGRLGGQVTRLKAELAEVRDELARLRTYMDGKGAWEMPPQPSPGIEYLWLADGRRIRRCSRNGTGDPRHDTCWVITSDKLHSAWPYLLALHGPIVALPGREGSQDVE